MRDAKTRNTCTYTQYIGRIVFGKLNFSIRKTKTLLANIVKQINKNLLLHRFYDIDFFAPAVVDRYWQNEHWVPLRF